MNEGVTITFAVIFVLVGVIALVLFKEARTHRFWRQLVEENDIDAIRGIMEGEIERWRTQRPPKEINAAVWAGVQGMELLTANAKYVRLSTSAEPEFRMVEGSQQLAATALETARATAAQLLEMVFYDVPNYRPDVTRVDVYSAFRDAQGGAVPRAILSVTAEREVAMYIDWGASASDVIAEFEASFTLNAAGEAEPIELPPEPSGLAEYVPPAAQTDDDSTESDPRDRSTPVG